MYIHFEYTKHRRLGTGNRRQVQSCDCKLIMKIFASTVGQQLTGRKAAYIPNSKFDVGLFSLC